MSEEIDARFLRSMLYEPLPGSAAVILVQLGIVEQGQVEALGQRTYDAESGRLSLALDDGRTVELERAMHLQSEDGYAVRIRSRAGQTISRSFIHIDRNLAVRNLHNDRMVYIDDAETEAAPDFSSLETLDTDSSDEFSSIEAREQTRAEELEAQSPDDELEEAPHAAYFQSVLEPEPAPAPTGSEFASSDVAAAHAESAPQLEYINTQADPEPDSAHTVPQPSLMEPNTTQAATEPDLPSLEVAPESITAPPEPEAATEGPTHTGNLATAPPAELESPAQDALSAPELPESQDIVDPIAPEPELQQPETAAPSQAAPEASEEPLLEAAPEPEPTRQPGDSRYSPLHESLSPEDAALFDFIAQTGTVHTYEHRETFRYIHIDAPSGLFYDQARTPISRTAALKHALTPRIPISVPQPQPTPKTTVEPTPPSHTVTEPELRTRSHSLTNGHVRAAIKPDPDPAATTTPETGLSFDAFTRKRAQLERDSWRDRIAEISRALRRNRPPTDS